MRNSSYVAKVGSHHVTVGESEVTFYPGDPRPPGHYPVVYLHGAGAGFAGWSSPDRHGSTETSARVTLAGIPGVSLHMHGDTFANDVAMDDIDDAIAWLDTTFPDSDTSKVCLVGASMGGGTAIRYASLNPTKVACVAAIIPMCNIDRLYQNNTLGLRATIGTAWGVTWPTPLPAGADLFTLAEAMDTNNIPIKLWYDDNDTAILPADVTNMASIIGSTAQAIEIPDDFGHSEAEIKSFVDLGAGEASELINFLLANGA